MYQLLEVYLDMSCHLAYLLQLLWVVDVFFDQVEQLVTHRHRCLLSLLLRVTCQIEVRLRFVLVWRDVDIRLCIFIIVVVVFEVKVFADGPVAKLIEENFPATIPVHFLPGLFGVSHVDAPGFKFRFGGYKLLIRNTTILVGVDSLESDPVFVILSQEFEQDTELSLANIVICI